MKKSNPIANLQIVTNCPMCDAKYDKENVKTVNKKDGMITLYLNCQRCGSSMMMAIMTGALGITSVSMMTDFTEDDLRRMESGYIEYDDVLEMHKFLEGK